MTEVTKKPTTKPKKETTAKASTARKPKVVKKEVEEKEEKFAPLEQQMPDTIVAVGTVEIPEGRYIYATGRRKTAVANIRMFSDKGDSVVNKKAMNVYFSTSLVDKAYEPFRLTGSLGKYKILVNVSGGGTNAQAEAIRHGIAQALSSGSEEIRKIMKKNGFLTRDDRRKERKKPGLKRARRSPQWAKR